MTLLNATYTHSDGTRLSFEVEQPDNWKDLQAWLAACRGASMIDDGYALAGDRSSGVFLDAVLLQMVEPVPPPPDGIDNRKRSGFHVERQ